MITPAIAFTASQEFFTAWKFYNESMYFLNFEGRIILL